jgi:UDP-3-O-[3-hydroxymyristoyl] N-acetylglucosamine deacetylase
MFSPSPAPQKTLKAPIHCTGIGVHTGTKAALILRPAAADTGIIFRRLDVVGGPVDIVADWANASESPLCTVLQGARGATVMTIEHLMAALAGCAIDNCIVEINGPEVPIMDGSAAPFVFLIECAGTVAQRPPRRAIKVLKSIRVGDERASASLEPDDLFSVDFQIDFTNPVIGHQMASLVIEPASFKTDISRARSFGFLEDVERLRAAGRGMGGSLDNVIVIDGDRVLNEGGLRYADEFVRHKVLDAVGDLYLAGAPLLGHFTGIRSSHALNRRLLAALFADRDAWRMTRMVDPDAYGVGAWDEPVHALSA